MEARVRKSPEQILAGGIRTEMWGWTNNEIPEEERLEMARELLSYLRSNGYQLVQWRPITDEQKDGREITVRLDYGKVLTVTYECRYEDIGPGWYEGEEWWPPEEFAHYFHGLKGPEGEG